MEKELSIDSPFAEDIVALSSRQPLNNFFLDTTNRGMSTILYWRGVLCGQSTYAHHGRQKGNELCHSLALTRADAAVQFKSHIERAYYDATSMTPDVYICEPADGADVWLGGGSALA